MKGRIFRYAKYKAWNEAGIITCRVNPKYTSRACARCGAQVIRYAQGQPEEGYQMGAPLVICPDCNMRGHADRNASLKIGQRLMARYHKTPKQEKPEEKPHAPLPRVERSAKAEGVLGSQDERREKATIYGFNRAWNRERAWHREDKGKGDGWVSLPSLSLLNYAFQGSRGHVSRTSVGDYRGVEEAAGF